MAVEHGFLSLACSLEFLLKLELVGMAVKPGMVQFDRKCLALFPKTSNGVYKPGLTAEPVLYARVMNFLRFTRRRFGT